VKRLSCLLLLAPALAQAQIYRCDTPQGPVFSDERCGSEAQVVQMKDESTGLGGGPSAEVRAYLDKKREQRAEKRQNAPAVTSAQQAEPAQAPQQVIVYPVNRPYAGRPNRPGKPVHRPRPDRPEAGPGGGEKGPDSVLRPLDGDGN